MTDRPPVADEAARLSALESYGILDTPAEPGYDDIVLLARQICDTPVALVSLVADDRQWFKARVGFEPGETPIGQSVCWHALRQPGLLVIPDLTRDPRTRANTLVTGHPHIRFYAGARLDTPEGLALGTVCVIDTKPRPGGLTPSQAAGLAALARQVMAHLALRRAASARDAALAAVREQEARHRQILESAIDYAIVTMDLDGLVTGWNAGAENILGWTEREMIGRPARTFFTQHDQLTGTDRQEMKAAREEGRGNDERWHVRKDGTDFWARGEMMPLTDDDDTHVGYLKILRDHTSQREAAVALQRQTDLLRTVTDHVSEAVFQLDTAGLVIFANPAAADMLGWSVAELVGANLHDVAHHHHSDGAPFPASDCILVQSLSTGTRLQKRDTVFFRRDGTPIDVLVSNSPVIEADQIKGAVLTIVEVTERKRSADRLAALVRIGDRLRTVEDTTEIVYVAAEITGRTMGLSCAAYGTADPRRGLIEVKQDWFADGGSSVAGSHRFADFGSFFDDLVVGETVIIPDVRKDGRVIASAMAALNVGSLLNVPVMEHGRLVAVFCLLDARARHWSPGDVEFVKMVADRTRAALARRRAEEEQDLLNHELSHRMKNLLAMVQSIANQTMRSARDVNEAKAVLAGRLMALGHAHDLLLGGALGGSTMAPIVRSAVTIHEDRPDRFRLGGPDLPIGAKPALALALMLHELATNAAKYGALSNDAGHVDIAWTLGVADEETTLRLSWIESGGPPVTPPARKGFGSRFIERGLAGQVGGHVSMAFEPSGVTCVVEGALSAFQSNI